MVVQNGLSLFAYGEDLFVETHLELQDNPWPWAKPSTKSTEIVESVGGIDELNKQIELFNQNHDGWELSWVKKIYDDGNIYSCLVLNIKRYGYYARNTITEFEAKGSTDSIARATISVMNMISEAMQNRS